MSDLSGVEIGKLIQAVKDLTERVVEVENELKGVRQSMNTTKGVALGVLILAGSAGAGLSSAIQKIFH